MTVPYHDVAIMMLCVGAFSGFVLLMLDLFNKTGLLPKIVQRHTLADADRFMGFLFFCMLLSFVIIAAAEISSIKVLYLIGFVLAVPPATAFFELVFAAILACVGLILQLFGIGK